MSEKFQAWGHCFDCHFDGLLAYHFVDGEDYTDPESLGVVLRQVCPACETAENTLIPMDHFLEMLGESGTEPEPLVGPTKPEDG